jgi:hypothetical protein
MTLQDALHHFKNLESETTDTSEIQVYQKFIQLLTRLENRGFSDIEVEAIEQKLDTLDLKSTSLKSKKHFRSALRQFQNYLKDTYSLTSKRYYTNMWLGLGASFGVAFGAVFLSGLERSLGISFGISLGMVIGLIIGRNLDAQARAAGKVI